MIGRVRSMRGDQSIDYCAHSVSPLLGELGLEFRVMPLAVIAPRPPVVAQVAGLSNLV